MGSIGDVIEALRQAPTNVDRGTLPRRDGRQVTLRMRMEHAAPGSDEASRSACVPELSDERRGGHGGKPYDG